MLESQTPDPITFLPRVFEALIPAFEAGTACIPAGLIHDVFQTLWGKSETDGFLDRHRLLWEVQHRMPACAPPTSADLRSIARDDAAIVVSITLWRFHDELEAVGFEPMPPAEITGTWLRQARRELIALRFRSAQTAIHTTAHARSPTSVEATKNATGNQPMRSSSLASEFASGTPRPHYYLVSADQLAALAGISKKTLLRLEKKDCIPHPAQRGGNGKPHLWDYYAVRPRLQPHSKRPLPDNFPKDDPISE